MKKTAENKPANNDAKKPATAKKSVLEMTPAVLAKMGIELDNTADAAKRARVQLKEAGALYVPENNESGYLLTVLNDVRGAVDTVETAGQRIAIELALIDVTEAYKTAHNADGKPYTSTLALARDLLPHLQKSTVSSYIGTGRKTYLPAKQGAYGKAGKVLLDLPQSTADALKSVVGDDDTRDIALKAIAKATKGGKTLTQAKAKAIAKDIRDGGDGTGTAGTTANKASRSAGGAVDTATHGDAQAANEVKEMDDKAKLDAIKAICHKAFPVDLMYEKDGERSFMMTENGGATLKEAINRAIQSADITDARRMLVALRGVLFGAIK